MPPLKVSGPEAEFSFFSYVQVFMELFLCLTYINSDNDVKSSCGCYKQYW